MELDKIQHRFDCEIVENPDVLIAEIAEMYKFPPQISTE